MNGIGSWPRGSPFNRLRLIRSMLSRCSLLWLVHGCHGGRLVVNGTCGVRLTARCIYVGSGWFLASLMCNSSMRSIALLEGELKIIVNVTDSLVKRPPVALLPRGCLLGKR